MSPRIRKYYLSIPKDVLVKLEPEHYDGPITVIDKPEDVAEAIETLRKSKIIGFDTETRPSFKKGQSNSLALIQMCTKEQCFLFRVNIIGMVKPLIDLLEDAGKIKVGLSIHDDFHNLQKICNIDPQGFIDLQQFVKTIGIMDNSLTRIYAIIFNKRIAKGQRLSNWEAPVLTQQQQSYAALDAIACIRIYDAIGKNHFRARNSQYLLSKEQVEALINNRTCQNNPAKES